MGHFILSMVLLDAAFALAWCSRYEPWERRRSERPPRRLGGAGADPARPADDPRRHDRHRPPGPTPGAHEGQLVQRFDFEGGETLEWVVQRHAVLAAIFGIAAIGVWFLLRRAGGDRRALQAAHRRPGLLALQGVVGGVQWALELPAEIVWVHVALATCTWLAMLWTRRRRRPAEPRGASRSAVRAGAAPSPPRPAGAAWARSFRGPPLWAVDRRPQLRPGGPGGGPPPAVTTRSSQVYSAAAGPWCCRFSIVSWSAGSRSKSAAAHFLTWLALIAVPPLAALALAAIVHGAPPPLAP